MAMIKGFHHAGVSVHDLDRSIEFYRNLGMELLGRSVFEGGSMDLITALRGTRGRSAMLKAGDQHLELFEFCLTGSESCRCATACLQPRNHAHLP